MFLSRFILVHLEEFVDVLSGVGEAWHLMLSAKFALALEPIVEKSRAGLDDLQAYHIDALEALCLVVAVEFL